MESIVKDHLTNRQLNFRLLNCFYTWQIMIKHYSQLLDKGDSVDAIYLDFQKTFASDPSVPHQHLIQELSSFGIHAWKRFTVDKGFS